MPLTKEQTDIIKATVPVLQDKGVEITKHFYTRMLSENPEVQAFFNKTHQHNFSQPKALAGALFAYAAHIDDLGALGGLVERVVQKHCSLMVLPEHYPIVGKYLLNALVEVLGKDVANDAVIDAWGAAYQDLADLLIEAEGAVYDANAAAPGGWRGHREFKIAQKVPETKDVVSFYLKPVDGKSIIVPKPGQYLGFKFPMESGDIYTRQYSISADFKENEEPQYRVSIKRIPGGLISKHFHDELKVGDVVLVAPPCGDLILDTKNAKDPVVLIGAGIGVTPLVPMVEKALAVDRPVTFIQCDRDVNHQPFIKKFEEWTNNKNFTYKGFFSQAAEDAIPKNSVNRRIAKDDLKAIVSEFPDNVDIYLVGPPSFMHDVRGYVNEFNNPKYHLHFEFFGPATE